MTCPCTVGDRRRCSEALRFTFAKRAGIRQRRTNHTTSGSLLRENTRETVMCGICGQYNFGNGAPVLREHVEAMTGTIRHRGPDDDGYLFDGSLGLGFRRLSIIDLAGGHQPMADAEETVWVIFNGEIYNFREL